ncbi:MAG TPA: SIMPL domain-containing protein, partial [Acidobacteriaceae bacterium]|nr:SIMPL domain-containing protein [Acidobacteriaceae bacterium]
MKKSILGGLCLLVVAVPAMGCAQKIEVNKSNRTIAVTVTDKATEPADVATVHIGFKAYGPDSDSAYAAGSKVSNAVIDALKKAGVADKAIQSQAQNVQQNYQFDDKESEGQRAQKRYVLSQSWTVKASAADAAKVLHIAVEAGANDSGQIDWDVKDHA